ncbi:peptidylprolyl isomerase [Hyalangium minutum]|uniref:Survival protein SurA (Peptidyl-prolyl cis-trans isomerase SurA) n=1 Tax=Hyalangium minutum TaxID=394096 RepID=A0A085WK05_9BACT|nr:peptidylprolyl isomerase [Hyalangium minutum]KFE68018.1 Survival protein SurA precursor (Peptidyl-prolyl cis-trans isomerase SurA) [Hyalangium minutum]
MKTWLGVIAVAVLVVAGAARAELVDKVAAVVNRDIIALSEVQQRASPELARLTERDPRKRTEQRNQVMKLALDQLIAEKLVEAEVKELGLTSSASEIDEAMADVQRQNSITDPAQFEQLLAREGYTLKTYKEFLGKQIARGKLMQLKVSSKIKVSEEDLKAAYAQYAKNEGEDVEVHARHILVSVDPKATPEEVEAARKKALTIMEEARRPGMDFSSLAKARSEGPSKEDGGDLGFFRRGVMVPAFEKAAFSLKEGEVSEPIRTNFGWHVLKVEERRAVGVADYEELRPKLEMQLRQQKTEKFVDQYVQELKKKAVIEVKL